MSVCAIAIVAANSAVSRADPRDHRARDAAPRRRGTISRHDHVDAGGHHGRGVDQRRDRRRARHRVGQPDVERDLRRLAGRADEEAQPDHVDEPPAARPEGVRHRALGDRRRSARAMSAKSTPAGTPACTNDAEEQEDPEQEAEVADAVDDERLRAAVGVRSGRCTRSRSAGTSRGRRPPSRRTSAPGCRRAPAPASRT